MLASCVSAFGQGQTGGLTLREAIALALQQNAQVLQARESVAGAGARVGESRSGQYPIVNLQASYARLGPIASYTVAIGPMFPPITMKFGVENAYSAGMSVQHSLFNWGRTQAGIDISEAGLRMSESNLEVTRQVTAYQVIQTFNGILFSRAAIEVLGQSIRSLESRLAVTEKRFDAGLASDFDVLTIKVQIASVRSRKLDAESNLRRLEYVFNKLLGHDISAEVLLRGELHHQPVVADRENLIGAAMAGRRELEQLKQQETMALSQLSFSSSFDKPNVNLSLAWGLRNGFMPNLDVLRGNWNAGIVLAYPLFDGFRTRNQVDQAEVNVRLAQIRYDDVKASITLEVQQALTDLRANEEKISIEQIKVRQAEEALKIAEQRHEKGLLSTVDLLDFQTSLESARLNMLQATYGAIMSRFALDKAVGVNLADVQ